MSEISREAAFNRSIDLVMKQNDVVQDWVARFVLIQGGLGIGVGTLLTWKGLPTAPAALTFMLLLSFFGVACSILAGIILERHQRWQATYIEMVKRAEGAHPYLFQHDKKLAGPNLRVVFPAFCAVVIVGWVVVAMKLVADQTPVTIDSRAASLSLGMVALIVSLVAVVLAGWSLWRVLSPQDEKR